MRWLVILPPRTVYNLIRLPRLLTCRLGWARRVRPNTAILLLRWRAPMAKAATLQHEGKPNRDNRPSQPRFFGSQLEGLLFQGESGRGVSNSPEWVSTDGGFVSPQRSIKEIK